MKDVKEPIRELPTGLPCCSLQDINRSIMTKLVIKCQLSYMKWGKKETIFAAVLKVWCKQISLTRHAFFVFYQTQPKHGPQWDGQRRICRQERDDGVLVRVG